MRSLSKAEAMAAKGKEGLCRGSVKKKKAEAAKRQNTSEKSGNRKCPSRRWKQ